ECQILSDVPAAAEFPGNGETNEAKVAVLCGFGAGFCLYSDFADAITGAKQARGRVCAREGIERPAHAKEREDSAAMRTQMDSKPSVQVQEEANEQTGTQLSAICSLMSDASARRRWLTLGEIAAETGFGEASISAQLRHLRKPDHGQYEVVKRVRSSRA